MKTRVFTIISLLFLSRIIHGQTIERIEPPFWWAGMADPTLQILIYGEGLSGFEKGTTDSPLITVAKISYAENPDYLL
jgi:hypothetical protein